MEYRETITPSNPLRTVLDEMRRPGPNVGRLGEGLFDLSKALIPELGEDIERSRKSWERATNGGVTNERLVGMDEAYQAAFSTLATLGGSGKPSDYVFYLPDGGYSRLAFAKDEEGQIVVEVTYNSLQGVKEKFAKLFAEVKQSRSAAPSGLWGRLKSFVRR